MEGYLAEFNYLNHTDYEVNELFCSVCDKIYSTEVYTDLHEAVNVGKGNVCQLCYESQNKDQEDHCVINYFLMKRLSKAQFPCLIDRCNFKGVLSEFHKHPEICHFYDVDELLQRIPMYKHLALIKFVTLNSLSFELGPLLDLDIIIAQYKTNYFVVFIEKLNEKTISIKVGMAQSHGHNSSLKTFTIVQDYESMHMHQKGDMLLLLTILNKEEDANSPVLMSYINANAKVTIYFVNYETQAIKWSECPVCFKQLLDDVKYCNNDHVFCASCVAKINKCPVCRYSIVDTKVNLKNILPNDEFPCENFDKGCIEFFKLGDRTEHDTVCAFRNLICPVCSATYKPHEVLVHFKGMHDLHENFSILTLRLYHAGQQSVYIVYKSNLFCFTFRRATSETLVINMVNVHDIGSAAKYSYEIILMVEDKVFSKVSRICNTSSVKIENPNKNFIGIGYVNGEWIFNCQIKIIYNY